MNILGFSIDWYPRGMRPDYRRDPVVEVLRNYITGKWFAVWVGRRIRIGRNR